LLSGTPSSDPPKAFVVGDETAVDATHDLVREALELGRSDRDGRWLGWTRGAQPRRRLARPR
jgi:hypothetical protein